MGYANEYCINMSFGYSTRVSGCFWRRRGQSKGGARLIRVGETRLQSGEFQEGWRYANEPVSTLSPARSFLLEVRLWEELC